ncbi:MAG: 50S ribosomal protein L29 [Candidatus Aenigmarchaeota archaeon]|nr:50S ribosomal protein L29 [Candidatus Aenigmarchaeota archaeon]
MAIIRKKEMRNMGKTELEKKLAELNLELSKARSISDVGGSVKSPGKLKEIRRTIARIKTYINQKQRSENDNL